MRQTRAAAALVAVAVACASASCRAPEEADDAEPAATAAPLVASPVASLRARSPRDVGAGARHAFARDGAGWRAERGAYRVSATSDRLQVTPTRRDGDGDGNATIMFSTLHVGRGDAATATSAEGLQEDDDGALVCARGDAIERARALAEGVAVSWDFARPPRGSGDLVVRVGVGGAAFLGERAGGLRFGAMAEGGVKRGPVVTYGGATWIDATGARVAVGPRFLNGAIELRVPAAVVTAAVYPAVLDPVIGPELTVDPPSPAPARAQRRPAIAWGDGEYFVAWHDTTAGGGRAIYGARVSTAGTVVGSVLTIAATDVVADSTLGVAYGDHQYFVVWDTHVNFATYSVLGRRIASDGTLLGQTNITAAVASSTRVRPAVASDGTSYFVVWQDDAVGLNANLLGARITATGSNRDPLGAAVHVRAGGQSEPALAYDGAEYVVAWTEQLAAARSEIRASRVATSGASIVVANPMGVGVGVTTAGAGSQARASIGRGDAGRLFVAWEDTRDPGATHIYGGRVHVDASGVVADDGAGVAVSRDAANQEAPAIGFTGDAFVAAWAQAGSILNGYDVVGARVNALNGHVVDQTPIPISRAPFDDLAPSIAGQRVGGAGSVGRAMVAYARPAAGAASDRVYVRALEPDLGVGAACAGAHECASGYCVDGVCCASACGGGALDDCETCSGRGVGLNGQCGPVPAAAQIVCRPAANGVCDVRETCDGTAMTCPPDITRNEGATCAAGRTCEQGACVASPVVDAGVDASADAADAARDGAIADAADATTDANTDASLDARPADATADATADASLDARPADATADATADASLEARPADALADATPADAATDAAPPSAAPDSAAPGATPDLASDAFAGSPAGGGCACSAPPDATRSPAPLALIALAFGFTRRRRSSRHVGHRALPRR